MKAELESELNVHLVTIALHHVQTLMVYIISMNSLAFYFILYFTLTIDILYNINRSFMPDRIAINVPSGKVYGKGIVYCNRSDCFYNSSRSWYNVMIYNSCISCSMHWFSRINSSWWLLSVCRRY